MRNKNTNKSSGFTIIEVLIVLAIAGLIMLIVFLAVPALQRNSHNTQRKSDVSALIGAVQEYSNVNSGQLPSALSDFDDNAKLGFYDASSEVSYAKSASAVTSAPGTNSSMVYIRTYAKCNGNAVATSGATSRNVIAWYYVETSSGTSPQCQEM